MSRSGIPTGERLAIWDNRPPTPIGDKEVAVDVVGNRCVYVACHRIAGSKPYVSENLPSHSFKTTVREVLEAFSEEIILAALAERKAQREYVAACHKLAEGTEQSA